MKSKLEIVYEYYWRNRRVGHTTAMLNGATSNPNILVLVANEAQKKYIDLPKNQMINVNNLDMLRGRKNPILVEHHALQIMYLELNNELLKKDEYIEKLEEKIRYLEQPH